MTPETYVAAWLCYLISIVVALFGLKKFMRPWQSNPIKQTLWLVIAAVLLMPYPIGDGYSELAPAVLMFSMEALFEGNVARVGPAMLGAIVIALCLSAGVIWRKNYYQAQLLQRQKQQEIEAVLEIDRQELLQQSHKS
jgi:hypothetical protein